MPIARNLRLLAAFNFCTDFGFYAPVAILYFAHIAGSYALGMAVFSAIFLSQTLLEMPTGVLSDKWLQRKGSLICGAACATISIALYAYADSYYWLLAGAVLEGASRSFYSGTTEALLYETLQQTGREEEFHHEQGRVGSMFQFAAFAGALIGAVALLHSYKLALWLSVIPQIACFGIAWFFVEPTRHTRKISANLYAHTKEALAQFARNPRLCWLSVANAVTYGFSEANHQFSSAYVRLLIPDWAINLVRSLANLCSAASFWFAGRIINAIGYLKLFLHSTWICLVVQLIALALNNLFTPLLLALLSLFHGVNVTARSSLFQKEFTDEQRATIGSFVSLFGSLTFALVAVLLGWIADVSTPWMAVLIGFAAPKLVTTPIYWKTL